MTTDEEDNFDDKISTATADISAPELLDDCCVVTRGKATSTSVIQTITFTIVLPLQNHGLKTPHLIKIARILIVLANPVAGKI
jgi:hypothetical protein